MGVGTLVCPMTTAAPGLAVGTRIRQGRCSQGANVFERVVETGNDTACGLDNPEHRASSKSEDSSVIDCWL